MKVTFIICFIAQYWGYTDNDALWSARYCFSLVGRNYKEKGKYFKISFCSFIQANHGATIVWQYGSDIKIQEIELGSNVGRVLGVMRSKYVHNSIFLCMKKFYAWNRLPVILWDVLSFFYNLRFVGLQVFWLHLIMVITSLKVP